ncbi:MAG: hypothetical protein JWP74_2371 [Marmoricola sp.]|nr:hypothetical protein [Marmoricola sp.]
MNWTYARTLAVLGAVVSLAGPATTLSHATATGAERSLGAQHACLHPAQTSAAARGTTAHGLDTRGISAAQERAIEARTARILARKASKHRSTVAHPTINVPVYVHVMTSKSGAGNVTNARITKQIAVLNQTYSGQDVDHPGTLDAGVRFSLAGINRYANDTWHTDGQTEIYRAQTRQGGKNALNIWLVDFEYLGVATFPWDYAASPAIDGIRVQFTSVPGGSATHYNQGETATHETGHWLGLYHTFQGGCAAPGDEVADTAAQASPSSGCPTGRDSCTAPGLDPIHNYMDYSYDTCYYEFTPDQVARIAKMWTAYRA